ncbi:hypothetical protein [Neisseria perflava]|uniref:hypothetical protein n=1 Tax=Neisseria perflava TaxID=33053 RepID=UPI0020A15BB9|nr:hypothetical protein [Neisseria perflava]MCP1659142.1 hypothetical protein [Neisseria perflava]MCP1771361.1 hypothetical protein [Neisseria perflava]
MWSVTFRLHGLTKSQIPGTIEGGRNGSRQEYYLKVCKSDAPLQPVEWQLITYHEFSAKPDILILRPQDCQSEAAQAAIKRGNAHFASTMLDEDTRLDYGEVLPDNTVRYQYTLVKQDFSKIPPEALPALNAKIHALLKRTVCSPDGGLPYGIKSFRAVYQDKNGLTLPTVEILPVDCVKDTTKPSETPSEKIRFKKPRA